MGKKIIPRANYDSSFNLFDFRRDLFNYFSDQMGVTDIYPFDLKKKFYGEQETEVFGFSFKKNLAFLVLRREEKIFEDIKEFSRERGIDFKYEEDVFSIDNRYIVDVFSSKDHEGIFCVYMSEVPRIFE